jgi:hypothetical protein
LDKWIGKPALAIDIGCGVITLGFFASILLIRSFSLQDEDFVGRRLIARMGIALLFTIVFVLLALIAIVGFSAITYDVFTNYDYPNPFEVSFTGPDAVMFFIDQAMKGMFFDIMEVFDINFQDKLKFRARDYPFFGSCIVIFRMLISLITIGFALEMIKGARRAKEAARTAQAEGGAPATEGA